MIRLYDFDEVRPEEILNRDIRAEADVEATVDAIIADVRGRGLCRVGKDRPGVHHNAEDGR